MDNKLTAEEELMITRIEIAGKWDNLLFGLAYSLPCAIIVILSTISLSVVGIFIGVFIYIGLRLWISLHGVKDFELMRTAVIKLKTEYQKNNIQHESPNINE